MEMQILKNLLIHIRMLIFHLRCKDTTFFDFAAHFEQKKQKNLTFLSRKGKNKDYRTI